MVHRKPTAADVLSHEAPATLRALVRGLLRAWLGGVVGFGALAAGGAALWRPQWTVGVLAGAGLALFGVLVLSVLVFGIASGRCPRWLVGALLALKSAGMLGASAALMGVPSVRGGGFALGVSAFVVAAALAASLTAVGAWPSKRSPRAQEG